MNFYNTAGTFQDLQYVYLLDIKLPYFCYIWRVKNIKANLFGAPKVVYDVIFVHHFLNRENIDEL